MGVATAELPPRKHPEQGIPATAPSMSQGFHEGNLFSFSDEFERPQQNHVAQQSRRDKLRVQHHGFEAAAAAAADAATEHPLVTIQEEEEEAGGIYGPAGTSYMLSEMFNFPTPAHPDLHLAGHGASSSAGGYHRLIQHRPEFYGANRQDQVLLSPSATNWSSALAEDAAAVAKHHGMNPDSSSATMRHFFMNPSSVEGVIHNHEQSPSTSRSASMGGVGGGSSLQQHHHHPHHNQPFPGTAFGEAISFHGGGGGGGVRERHLGPSLTLSSSALQQLEMRKAEDEMRASRAGQASRLFFSNSSTGQQQEQQLHPNSIHQMSAPAGPAAHPQGQQNQGQVMHMSYSPVAAVNVFRNSKYARAAQDLLEEFCSVGRGHARGSRSGRNSSSNPNPSHGRGGASGSAAAAASSSSSKDIPVALSSSDRFEYQRKKSKLLSMLDEVGRRYNHYCEQMQVVVNSFDAVMGFGAATPYTSLAQKAMSRHFRCLKDAVAAQLRQTCELLGDRDGGVNASGGLTKGETPKLRLIDQSLRQQRAFHQLGMMDQDQAWRPQRGLPDRSVTILRAWLFDHFLHPYPSDADKHLLARQTGLSRNQVSNWFINARVRLWKPMVEDMYQQEAREEDDSQNNDDETNSQGIMSAAATALQQQSMPAAQHQATDFDALESVLIPRPNLRLSVPADGHPPHPPEAHASAAAAAAAGNFSPGSLEDDMYRRAAALLGPSAAAQARFGAAAAAAAAARSGDLSLTLGLRHAGGNPPETGPFGL